MKGIINRLFGQSPEPEPDPGDEFEGLLPPPPPRVVEPGVALLIAQIEGGGGREVTARIVQALGERDGVELRLSRRSLKTPSGYSPLERLAAAGPTGRAMLATEGGDVLVWGEAVGTEGGVILRFLSATLDGEARAGAFGPGDSLELPPGFETELIDVVFATAIAAALPVKGRQPKVLAKHLGSVMVRLGRIVDSPPRGLSSRQTASVLSCIGNCFAVLWRLTGEDVRLERAIAIYRKALDEMTRDEDPLMWALMQNHLATAAEALAGKRRFSDEELETAVKAYRSVSATLGRENHPSDWAFAQHRLGMVLYRLALRRDSDPTLLRTSAAAFEEALEVVNRDDQPDRWSEVMNQLGVTLMALGIQGQGTDVLARAAATFRETLEVRRRDTAPLLWAQTANNLGAVCFALCKRNKSAPLLEEAQACFEGAREIYMRRGRIETVRVIESNLDRVRSMMR